MNGQPVRLRDNRQPTSNLKSFSTLLSSREIKYQNRLGSQLLDNRPVLKYSTFQRNSPTRHASEDPSAVVDPIWLPRQSNESPTSIHSINAARGPLNNNCNNNSSHINNTQHAVPFSRVGVSPSCESGPIAPCDSLLSTSNSPVHIRGNQSPSRLQPSPASHTPNSSILACSNAHLTKDTSLHSALIV